MDNHDEKAMRNSTDSLKPITRLVSNNQILQRTSGAEIKTIEQLHAEINGYRIESERNAAMEQAKHKQTVSETHWETRLKQAAIPPRFRNRTLENLEPRDDIHGAMIRWFQQYVEHFDEMLALGRNVAMVGGPGTGKTHMACGVANALLRKRYRVAFTTVTNYFTNLHASYGETGGEQRYISNLADLDLLIIDEVGGYQRKDMESMRSNLFHLLNTRYENCKPTILLSNQTKPVMIDYIGERYERRLMENGGRVFALPWGVYEQGKQNQGKGAQV